MTTMIESVAKAIYESRNGKGCIPWARREKAHKEPYRADARAAIEAMRRFDLVMRDEVGVIHEVRGAPNDIWHAMIDASLGDSPDLSTNPRSIDTSR